MKNDAEVFVKNRNKNKGAGKPNPAIRRAFKDTESKRKSLPFNGLLNIPAADGKFLSAVKELDDHLLEAMLAELERMGTAEGGYEDKIIAIEKELRFRKIGKPALEENRSWSIVMEELGGMKLMGVRSAKKVAAIFARIEENEKSAVKLLADTAKLYYDAGNILAAGIRSWNTEKPLSAKAIAKASGFEERRIVLALKIFKHFEHNPAALDGLTIRDALKLIAPPPAGENGYNRVDLGGDPGQMKLDFGDLFELPAAANRSLQNYRTVGELISEIIVVRRTGDGGIISKRFAQFSEDVPQDPLLRTAYKTMSQKTQAAIEDYLAALEQKEGRG